MHNARKGVLAFGVVDVDLVEKTPPGYGPRDIFPRAKSVISIGVGGGTKAPGQLTLGLVYIGDRPQLGRPMASLFSLKKYRNERYFVLQTWTLKKRPDADAKS